MPGDTPWSPNKQRPDAEIASEPDASGGGLSQGVIHTKEQEAGIRGKAARGGIITNNDLGYLGHFAGDDVLHKGHNKGHKPLGTAHFTGMANKGFRRIPGTAANQIGCAKGEAPTGLMTRAERRVAAAAKRSYEKMAATSTAAPLPVDFDVMSTATKRK